MRAYLKKYLPISLFRRMLSAIPLLPVPVTIFFAPADALTFWWSRLEVIVNISSRLRLVRNTQENVYELAFLYRFLQPGMCFVDIGAHQGLYTVVAGKKLRDTGRIVAFEPSMRQRRRLWLHVCLNGFSNVVIEADAVSCQRARKKFFVVLDALDTINSLQYPQGAHKIEETTVTTISLDEYWKEKDIARMDVVKIDTEGAELDVFRGAQNVLSRYRPIVLCEVLDVTTKAWGYTGRDLIVYLQKLDYEWFEFQDNGLLLKHTVRSTYDTIFNYLAVPREKIPVVTKFIMT